MLLQHVSMRSRLLVVSGVDVSNSPFVVHVNLHQEPALSPHQTLPEAFLPLTASAQERDLLGQTLELALVALFAQLDASLDLQGEVVVIVVCTSLQASHPGLELLFALLRVL